MISGHIFVGILFFKKAIYLLEFPGKGSLFWFYITSVKTLGILFVKTV